jgi:hypothetical protein
MLVFLSPNIVRSIGLFSMSCRKNTLVTDRWQMLGSAIILIPIGYLIRFYGPGPEWLNDFLGSVMYEIFWITLFLGIWTTVRPLKMAVTVCLVTCALEFLQLWHPPVLQILRANLLGRLVLGTTFSWFDFPAYCAGSGLGFWWGRSLRTKRLLLSRKHTPQKPTQ